MMSTRILFYALAISSGVLGGIADCLMNRYAKAGGGLGWMLSAYLCWNLAVTVFFLMLRSGYSLAHSGAAFSVANDLPILLACWFVFREPLSATTWAGVGMMFAGLVVAEFGR